MSVADVVPLDVSGGIDMDLHDVSANDMMQWALANVGGEPAYAVRHGNEPVSTFGVSRNCTMHPYDVSNFFEKAFPCLFPYGRGGLEAPHDTSVGFREHIRWALQYHDRRFRTHELFPLVAFAISQRREAMMTSKIRIRHKDAHVLRWINLDKLKQAAKEESAGRPISDANVRRLKRYIQCSLSNVTGCNEVRRSWRSQIWSTNLVFGPPSLWLTINPSDIHDPIAQVMTGADIDLDDFTSQAGPNGKQRANNIANDPYAASKFFHFMIETIFETLLGIKVSSYQVKSELGVLGKIGAYFGVVECQGRGTLHFHCLIWLKDSPSGDHIQQLLKSEEFRQRMQSYIKANIRAYMPGLEDEETVKAMPARADVAFNRPPDPDHVNYGENVRSFELQLARAEQIHVCKEGRCYVRSRSVNSRLTGTVGSSREVRH